MITERQIQNLQKLLPDTTPGEWFISSREVETPTGRPKQLVAGRNLELVFSGHNSPDLELASMAQALLGEMLEEIQALRQLPGDHYQRAGLRRKLDTSRELRQLPVGSIISNHFGTWCAELDKKILRWRYIDPVNGIAITSSFVPKPVTVLYEPDN